MTLISQEAERQRSKAFRLFVASHLSLKTKTFFKSTSLCFVCVYTRRTALSVRSVGSGYRKKTRVISV